MKENNDTIGGYSPLLGEERQKFLRKWDIGVYDTLIKIKEPEDHNVLGIPLVVQPGVHAGLWADTKLLAKAIKLFVNENDKFLDLGTSTGIQSLIASKITDNITAIDFNKESLLNAQINFEKNGVADKIKLFESDGFNNLVGEKFDVIAINPPFRWFKPKDILDAASNDENYKFLNRFLKEAKEHLTENGRILLVFANTGDIGYLQYLFGIYRYKVKTVLEDKPDDWRIYNVFELKPMRNKNESS